MGSAPFYASNTEPSYLIHTHWRNLHKPDAALLLAHYHKNDGMLPKYCKIQSGCSQYMSPDW